MEAYRESLGLNTVANATMLQLGGVAVNAISIKGCYTIKWGLYNQTFSLENPLPTAVASILSSDQRVADNQGPWALIRGNDVIGPVASLNPGLEAVEGAAYQIIRHTTREPIFEVGDQVHYTGPIARLQSKRLWVTSVDESGRSIQVENSLSYRERVVAANLVLDEKALVVGDRVEVTDHDSRQRGQLGTVVRGGGRTYTGYTQAKRRFTVQLDNSHVSSSVTSFARSALRRIPGETG